MRPLCADWREAGVLCALRRLTAHAREAEVEGWEEWEDWYIEGSVEEAASRAGNMPMRQVAACRVRFGALLEGYAETTCAHLCTPGRADLEDDAHGKRRACQLYFDAYAAACWTSAHAEYLAALESGIAEPPSPTISSVPCASAGYDLGELFARRSASRDTNPKAAEPLIQLLSRCTNPGARGWDTVLKDALAEAATNDIIKHALLVCLTGMHPQLHPSLRPDWKARMRMVRCCAAVAHKDAICNSATYVKEAMRRCLASTMASSSATHAALSMLGHPVRHLHQPPFNFPHLGMEAAMAAFVAAGRLLSSGSEPQPLSLALTVAFKARTPSAAELPDAIPDGLPYEGSWLGKGTANVHARQSLVELASDVWAAGFKAHFIAFWLFAQSHELRVSRLDATQHAAIHGMNTATQLAAQLDEETALEVQRVALSNPASGIMTVGEVAALLNVQGLGATSPNGGARSTVEAVRLLSEAGAVNAAKLLSFARVAWLNEEVLVVDLGARTTAMQAAALRKRLQVPEDTPVEAMPLHCTHVCACPECRRVANAHSTASPGAAVAFNELGVSSCQIAWGAPTVQLHCAKRSSAALRTAIAFESEMKRRKIEGATIDRQAISLLTAPRRASGVESGIAARVRRDAKNALEQRPSAVACGESPMIIVPIVGRAVRLYKQWYALCSYCAALTRVAPHLTRYGAEICCLRCDHAMLWRNGGGEAAKSSVAPPQRLCRFCGAVDTANNWKEIKAPLDVAGANAALPPPLRKVYYCRSHFRSWIPNAHRVLETRAVLAHICHNAKPVFGSNPADETLASAEPPKKKRCAPVRRLPRKRN